MDDKSITRAVSAPRLTRLFWLVLWCGVIFGFSQMPGSGFTLSPPLWYVLERKSAHLVEYAVLAILAYRFFVMLPPSTVLVRRAFLVTFIFVLTYGALDEFHQSFVFGRGARLSDVAIDGLGALIGLILLKYFRGSTR